MQQLKLVWNYENSIALPKRDDFCDDTSQLQESKYISTEDTIEQRKTLKQSLPTC